MRVKLKKIVNSKDLICTVDNRKMVRSIEFYRATGLLRNNYTRWMNETALTIGEAGTDYIPCPGNIERKEISRFINYRIRYYFSIDFAIILCGVARRKEAILLMHFLRKQL
jgi:hypothetical protein